MGSGGSSQRIMAAQTTTWRDAIKQGETVAAALARLDEEIANSERSHPTARLAVVTAELDTLNQEIASFEDSTGTVTSKDSYAKTIHQVFVSLDLYRRPVLATDNEDFIANVNRKEMQRLELAWLRARLAELQRERHGLQAQILRTRSLYAQLHHLLEHLWGSNPRPGTAIESQLSRAHALRDALSAVSARLRAAAEYSHAATRTLDDAMPAWKLTTVGKNGWERTAACADASFLLVRARCQERGARRVLSAPAAPRASRTLRLALDYAFTDAVNDHKHQRASEIFAQFKESVLQMINSIHQAQFASTPQPKPPPCKPPPCKAPTSKAPTNKTPTSKPPPGKPPPSKPPPPPATPVEVQIFINGVPVLVPSHFTVLQALRREGITFPSFCYHERLSIAGNCRMCLVQVEGMIKPQIACSFNVMKNMKILTDSPVTLQAQEGVLEFILFNHPLDCPICDQGGECDLQDLSMRFGNDRSRFTDIHFSGKRASEDKDLGPFIRTKMNRCIHCTRCIRFASQICGLDVLGTTGRGTDMQVGTYVDKMFLSELSGNAIDLCPVGALTSIPYMFKARPWEVKKTNSIDVTDATGTNIVLNYRFDRVLRVLPRENGEVNQEWVSDKGRWAIDSLEMQRLVTPMLKCGDCLKEVDWCCALQQAGELIKNSCPNSVMAVAGPHCNVETLVAAKDLLNSLGSEHTYVERALFYSVTGIDIRAGYSINVNMKDIVKADKIILVGTNPRFEAPILNTWIRQAYLTNETDIYYIGPPCDFNYYVNNLGADTGSIVKIENILKDAKNPLIFVGISQLETGNSSMGALAKYANKFQGKCEWGVLNIIPREASWSGALEAGWKPGAVPVLRQSNPKVLISLGADEIFNHWCPPVDCAVIYIGFQGDRGAQLSQIVLPGSAYTESGGIYLNMECRSQYAMRAVTPPGKARFDWKIIRALAEFCGVCLYYTDDSSLCSRLSQISPNFCSLGDYQKKLFSDLMYSLIFDRCNPRPVDVDLKTLKDYYCTDVFSYNSPAMVRATQAAEYFSKSPYSRI